MNYYTKKMALLLIMIALPCACSSAPRFTDVMNKDWKLVEIRTGPESIAIEGTGEMFTLRFDKERVNGIGAPNRYFAPYLLAEKQGISINAIAQTQMAALFEPEYLKEFDFFNYLQKTTRWNLAEGNMELHTTEEDGAATILVFAP